MLGVKKDVDSLVHILLGVFAQGESFYESQKDEIKSCFGEDTFNEAEKILKETRIYNILMNS